MSDLYERLRELVAETSEVKGCGECGQPFGVTAAMRAVVELHKPVKPFWNTPQLDCHGCDPVPHSLKRAPWPCSTIRAVARSLDVEIPE